MDHVPTGTGDSCLKIFRMYPLFQMVPPLVLFSSNITPHLEVSKFFSWHLLDTFRNF